MTDTAQAIYDRLWQEAWAAFDAGHVRVDPHLNRRGQDTRRGLSLIARPAPGLQAAIHDRLADLRRISPAQHFYEPAALHLTVLSLISAHPGFRLIPGDVAAYRAVLAPFLAQAPPCEVRFHGVGASPDSIFIAGSSPGEGLNALRDGLRDRLAAVGLDGSMDRRYRLVTAHMTILRFRSQPRCLADLRAYLLRERCRPVGELHIDALELVFNDWYMSPDRVEVLARFPLEAAG